MRTRRYIAIAGALLMAAAAVAVWRLSPGWIPFGGGGDEPGPIERYVGSADCRECHEEFYRLWSTSHHGLAMQPFTPEFARAELSESQEDVTVGDHAYRAEFDEAGGRVRDRGPSGETSWPIVHVLGGKNVYYFLTPMDRGRLQVLPVAYDVRSKRWYDTAGSGVRHFHDRPADRPLPWTDPAYTFNTSCHSCHVSQLATNYDPQTDAYRTTWVEPGINCETCHGPGGEHVRLCQAAPKDRPPADLKILSMKRFTAEQVNSACSTCHAKASPITAGFQPGEQFFDHYDLVTLEDPDFYPDGRDLGENYTCTLWLTSPCARSGKLDCLHCHTSSGRYRFTDPAEANRACLPCHEKRVSDVRAHARHEKVQPVKKCIDCHMPRTAFARMVRTDHSMRPPTPAVTLAMKSPNACNICHTDKDAAWADGHVRKWHTEDYQARVLARAGLIADARKRDWRRLDDMLRRLNGPDGDEVLAVSLVRLLGPCPDARKGPALLAAMKHPSPLVRSAAATALADDGAPEAAAALLEATGDDFRLVRIRAAAALAGHPRRDLDPSDLARLERATAELEQSLTCRPDSWVMQFNHGIYLAARGESDAALAAYAAASRLRPDAVPPLLNASMIHAALGRLDEAERELRTALRAEPNDPAVNFNLALLLAEKNDLAGAEQCLRAVLKAEPNMADAAYNLGILLADKNPTEAVGWCRKAVELRPDSAKFAYTLAFYLDRAGDRDGAVAVLARLVDAGRADAGVYAMLAEIYRKQGKTDLAKDICRRALADGRLSLNEKVHFQARLQALESP